MLWQWEIKMSTWVPIWNSAAIEAAFQSGISSYPYQQDSMQFKIDFERMCRTSSRGSRQVRRLQDPVLCNEKNEQFIQSLSSDQRLQLQRLMEDFVQWGKKCNHLNEDQTDPLTAKAVAVCTIADAPQAPLAHPIAEAQRYFDRYSGGFEGTFASVKTFFGGLDRLIGRCSRDVEKGMAEEHTRVQSGYGQSDVPFAADGTSQTPRECWAFVVTATGSDSVDYLLENAHKLINESFAKLGFKLSVTKEQIADLKLTRSEILGARLYSGPMYVMYNGVLRAYGNFKKPGFVLRGDQAGMCVRERFTCTIHAITSCILKLSRVQPCFDVWRGVRDMRLPEAFLNPDEFNVRGGVEFGFTSTTFNRSVALRFAADAKAGAPALVMKLRMGMVNRGAIIDWLSLNPDEKEALWPPLLGLENMREYEDGRVQCHVMEPYNNLQVKTLEQLLGERREQLSDLTRMLTRDVTQAVERARQDVASKSIPMEYRGPIAQHFEQAMQYWTNCTERDADRSAEWCSKDGNFLLALKDILNCLDNVLGDNENAIKRWTRHLPPPAGKPQIVEAHKSTIQAMVFMPERDELATASEGEIKVWTVSDWQGRKLGAHEQKVNSLVWISSRHILASSVRDEIALWAVQTGMKLRSIDIMGLPLLVFLDDRDWLAACCMFRKIAMYDVDCGDLLFNVSIADDFDQMTSAVYFSDLLALGAPCGIRVWSASSRKVQVVAGYTKNEGNPSLQWITRPCSLVGIAHLEKKISVWAAPDFELCITVAPSETGCNHKFLLMPELELLALAYGAGMDLVVEFLMPDSWTRKSIIHGKLEGSSSGCEMAWLANSRKLVVSGGRTLNILTLS